MLITAAAKTRDIFWHLPDWAVALWYVLAFVSVGVFLWGVARAVARYRRGSKSSLPPLSEIPGRLLRATKQVFGHKTIGRRDWLAGRAHQAVFYGFLTLFIGTLILGLDTDVAAPLGLAFFKGDFYLGYSLVLDVLGLALLAGLLVFGIRRGVLRPRKLDYTRPDRKADEPQFDRRLYRVGDWVFLFLLLLLVVTGYLLEGVRIAMDNPGFNQFSPVGWLVAQGWSAAGMNQANLTATRESIWWFHGLVALAFVASIPYTKAVHIFASFASTVLRDPLAGKRLRPIPSERIDQPGYRTLAEFSVFHLLELDACTKCGKCHEVCPATATGQPLSPRDVVLELHEKSEREAGEMGIGGVLGSLLGNQDQAAAVSVIGEDAVRPSTLWACMQCNACVEICPVGIEQAPMINEMRRGLVEEGEMDTTLQTTLQTIHKSGNSFGEKRRQRGNWTRPLEFEVKDARQDRVDVLWFVGDYASFDPRSQQVSQHLARILHEAGVDYGILYDGERNSGNDVRRAGEEGLFEALAEHNVESLSSCEFNRIVTSDPHSLNTLQHEYGDYGGSWEVIHHSDLLLELLEADRIAPREPLGYDVTYHDPCYLGRMGGGYEAPRTVLGSLGCNLIEMPRNRDNSFCCGAGGGRIWMQDEPGQERPSENRIREALALGPLDFFVVSCPKDVTMYEDAIKTTGNAELIQLRELTELVAEACGIARPASVF